MVIMSNTEFEKQKIEIAKAQLNANNKKLNNLFNEYEKRRDSFFNELAAYYKKRVIHLKK